MKLPRDFYRQPALAVAREILGCLLVHAAPEGLAVGRIIETEAYGASPDDTACHACRGPTQRTAVMFGTGGFAYVYLMYGMHHCFNIVTGQSGDGQAVLIRALEPVEGIELMMARRQTNKLRELCSGPGKLCQALAVNRTHNGMDLTGDSLYISPAPGIPDSRVSITARINVEYAGAAKDFPWRFVERNNPLASRKG